MATGLLALFDDIAMLADDVAVGAKISAQKTAGVLGDDLAVNATKASGFDQSRELIVIWEIMKGSLKNKFIILPIAFLLSAFVPSLIGFILVLGGIYLIYEGAEKIEEWVLNLLGHNHEDDVSELVHSTSENILDIEQAKIKSAIITDFILSIEIVVIALGTVATAPLNIQIWSTTIVALIATIGVYGLVAAIVRIDNVGFWLIDNGWNKTGLSLVSFMPQLIRFLGVVGTIAMVLVGGGIIAHQVPFFHHYFLESIPMILNEMLVGLVLTVIMMGILYTYSFLKNNVK